MPSQGTNAFSLYISLHKHKNSSPHKSDYHTFAVKEKFEKKHTKKKTHLELELEKNYGVDLCANTQLVYQKGDRTENNHILLCARYESH